VKSLRLSCETQTGVVIEEIVDDEVVVVSGEGNEETKAKQVTETGFGGIVDEV
jgi:hypothetical protein